MLKITKLSLVALIVLPVPAIGQNVVVSGTTTVQAAITACLGMSSCGEVYIPAGTYSQSIGPLTCSPSNQNWIRIRGASMDLNYGTILLFTGATDGVQLGGSCTLEDVAIVTANASGGKALRYSGLKQEIRHVQIAQTGSGLWATGVQNYGAVDGTLSESYIDAESSTVGAEVAPNGTSPAGAANFINDEIRAVTTGMHITGTPGALNVNVFGGSIENAGTNGLLDDSTGSTVNVFSTEFEQNGTNDVNLISKSAGSIHMVGTLHPGGTTNILNCPNTTCTAQVNLDGVISQNSSAYLILGSTTALRSSIINSTFAGSKFTNSLPSAVTLLNDRTLDSTQINNAISADGNGSAKVALTPGGGGPNAIIQQSSSGITTIFNNGIAALQIDGSGDIIAASASFRTTSLIALQLTNGGQAIRGTGSPGDSSYLDLGNVTFRDSNASTGGSVNFSGGIKVNGTPGVTKTCTTYPTVVNGIVTGC